VLLPCAAAPVGRRHAQFNSALRRRRSPLSWDAITATAEAAGALGVLISIVYLALQVKQSTEKSRITRGQNLITANSEVNALVANNPELSHIVRTGMLDFASLSQDDQFRFSMLFFSFMTKNDFNFQLWRGNRLESAHWERTEFELRTFLVLPGCRDWWGRDKARFSGEFVEYVDSLLETTSMQGEVPTLGTVGEKAST